MDQAPSNMDQSLNDPLQGMTPPRDDEFALQQLPRAKRTQHHHVCYASVNEVPYPRLPPGAKYFVRGPNGEVCDEPLDSETLLVTRGSTSLSEGNHPDPRHCAHFQFGRACQRGARCEQIHAACIQPIVRKGQRPPHLFSPIPKAPKIGDMGHPLSPTVMAQAHHMHNSSSELSMRMPQLGIDPARFSGTSGILPQPPGFGVSPFLNPWGASANPTQYVLVPSPQTSSPQMFPYQQIPLRPPGQMQQLYSPQVNAAVPSMQMPSAHQMPSQVIGPGAPPPWFIPQRMMTQPLPQPGQQMWGAPPVIHGPLVFPPQGPM